MTHREVRGYLDAIARERHTDEAFLWGLMRRIVLSSGNVKEGSVEEYPDYEGPEEGQLPEDWEEAASASTLVRRVEVSQPEPSSGDPQ